MKCYFSGNKLEALGYYVWGRKRFKSTIDGLQFKYADTIAISVNDEIRRFKTPELKEITVEWVMERLNKESSYNNLRIYLANIFGSGNIYAASYGIGIDAFLGRHVDAAKKIETKLKELGLKYRCEYSGAGWIYRFVLSKNYKNMQIIKSL